MVFPTSVHFSFGCTIFVMFCDGDDEINYDDDDDVDDGDDDDDKGHDDDDHRQHSSLTRLA